MEVIAKTSGIQPPRYEKKFDPLRGVTNGLIRSSSPSVFPGLPMRFSFVFSIMLPLPVFTSLSPSLYYSFLPARRSICLLSRTLKHLKEEGERAIASVHDYIAGNPLSFHLGHTQSVLAMSSRLSSPVKRSESVVGQRYPETAAENAAMHTTQSRTAASAMARPREDESSDQLRVHHDPKDHEPSAPAPAVTTGRRAVDVPDAIADALRATRGSLTGIPVTSVVGAGRSDTEAVDEVEGTASSTKWLKRIDLSRHQICDDGAVALALAMRHNVRVKVGKSVEP